MKDTKKLVLLSLFITLNVVLTRYLSYETASIRIGLNFIPIALCSMFFGPLYGGIAAAIADVIGMILFPKGVFFPGFTLSAFFTGAIYGLFLYAHPKTVLRISLAVIFIAIFITMGLNTLWLQIMLNKAFFIMLPGRIVKELIMIPMQILLINIIWKRVGIYLELKSTL